VFFNTYSLIFDMFVILKYILAKVASSSEAPSSAERPGLADRFSKQFEATLDTHAVTTFTDRGNEIHNRLGSQIQGLKKMQNAMDILNKIKAGKQLGGNSSSQGKTNTNTDESSTRKEKVVVEKESENHQEEEHHREDERKDEREDIRKDSNGEEGEEEEGEEEEKDPKDRSLTHSLLDAFEEDAKDTIDIGKEIFYQGVKQKIKAKDAKQKLTEIEEMKRAMRDRKRKELEAAGLRGGVLERAVDSAVKKRIEALKAGMLLLTEKNERV
jgi:hypothetical protein